METLWNKIKKSVVEGVTVAAEKTEELTKLGKVKIEILNTKRKITVKFSELGSIVYDAVRKGTEKDEIASEKVKKLVAAVQKLEEELAEKERQFEEIHKKTGTASKKGAGKKTAK